MKINQELNEKTELYAQNRKHLAAVVESMQQEIDQIKQKYRDQVTYFAQETANSKAELIAFIEDNKSLFDKPRTRELHGIKVGLRKAKGSVTFKDEARSVQLIRNLLPEEQSELLINVKESVYKPAVTDLSVADLRRLGITVEADTDVPVVKDNQASIDKLVDEIIQCNELQEAA